MAQYLIKDTTLTGIADAIRSKTGSADPIVVSDMASQIEGITGGGSGGGSVEGVHYVTFMSEDGTKELYNRPVADGDDCADPVERGYISAPTKESTVQYDYSYVGWATTPNGAWDENALKAIKADKTVYAAFEINVAGGTFTSGAKWRLNEHGVLTVYGEGSMDTFASVSSQPWNEHLEDIRSVVIEEGITNVSFAAFYGATALTSAFIANSVTNYKTSIFRGCSALKNVKLSDNATIVPEYMFFGCVALQSITIPDGASTIGQFAFSDCSALTDIDVPDSVTTLGISVFKNCAALTEIILPAGVTQIPDSCFTGCNNLTDVTIPERVTAIGRWAFQNCAALKSVAIGNGVTSIGSRAFYNDTALASAYFKDTTTWYVGSSAGSTTTSVDVTNTLDAATYLRSTHGTEYWTKA